jgi:hypothetical protein
MRRLPLLDALLIAALVPVWVSALSLHLWQQRHGNLALVGFYVSSATSAADYPRIRAFWPGQKAGRLPSATRFVPLGRRISRARVRTDSSRRARGDRQREPGRVPVGDVRARRPAHGSGTAVVVADPWQILPLSVGFAVAGTLVLLSRPGVAVARRSSGRSRSRFTGPGSSEVRARSPTPGSRCAAWSPRHVPADPADGVDVSRRGCAIRWGWLFAIVSRSS